MRAEATPHTTSCFLIRTLTDEQIERLNSVLEAYEFELLGPPPFEE